MRLLGFTVSMIAGLVGIGAGIYLLAQQSANGNTWAEVFAHGLGIFFVACGLYMIGNSIAGSASPDK